MKISQEVRHDAAAQTIEAGMADMSENFRAKGGEIYLKTRRRPDGPASFPNGTVSPRTLPGGGQRYVDLTPAGSWRAHHSTANQR
ncbi:hypothetical protein ACNKHQ_23655 [Shigella flexneri]